MVYLRELFKSDDWHVSNINRSISRRLEEFPIDAAASHHLFLIITPVCDQENGMPVCYIENSGKMNNTKIRIVSTVNETRESVPYGECTFQWVYQPDGSSTFPAK